jgi:caspase domain-containing protein
VWWAQRLLAIGRCPGHIPDLGLTARGVLPGNALTDRGRLALDIQRKRLAANRNSSTDPTLPDPLSQLIFDQVQPSQDRVCRKLTPTKTFRRLGFSVTLVKNGTFDSMRRALLNFAQQTPSADIAVVYFAGHGMEIRDENWLIPVDAELKMDFSAGQEAISLGSVLPPRDHFCRSAMAPRASWPTTWNEFLPISMPTTAIALSSFWDMACSLSLAPPPSILCWWGGSTTGPSH